MQKHAGFSMVVAYKQFKDVIFLVIQEVLKTGSYSFQPATFQKGGGGGGRKIVCSDLMNFHFLFLISDEYITYEIKMVCKVT